MDSNYIYASKRLGFRDWRSEDIPALIEMCADERVMEHFPKPLNEEESIGLYNYLLQHYQKQGYTYFATEVLSTKEYIGFIGLAFQSYESPFTPATDIGWRLKHSAWGNGYATEGALRTLEYAFHDLHLDRVVSTCTTGNTKSERVMQKIGMEKKGTFKHPRLIDYPDMKESIWYELLY